MQDAPSWVGAGIAGLAAAGALADWFESVTVLDRDHLPDGAAHRPGAPQGWHSHGLLLGGLAAIEGLFPGIGDDFSRAGAAPVRINRDLREELPTGEAMPQRDFGQVAYTMTRPLIEATLRGRLAQRGNVAFRQNCRALGFLAGPEGRVDAVRFVAGESDRDEMLPADLVVDASGRGSLTTSLLESIGREAPAPTVIGIDLRYTTAIIDIPDDAPADWKAVLTHANPPHSSRRAVMLPIEHDRWILSVVGRGDRDCPPDEWDALLGYLRHLATPTIYDAVRRSAPAGRLMRFGFPESVWRHYERMERFPDGLVPIGDAICRFNPV